MYNDERVKDVTAGLAMKHINSEDRYKAIKLYRILSNVLHLAGYCIKGNISLQCISTGRTVTVGKRDEDVK